MTCYSKYLYIVCLLLLAILIFSTYRTFAKNLNEITLVLDWTPNTNHTGIIVAKKLRYYEQENLKINLVQPGKGSAEQLVAKNLANFGISSGGSLVEAHMKGLPLVSIAAIIAHNTSGFYSLKYKNILSPKDFEGKVYGSWGSKLEVATIKAMMNLYGADFSKVKIVTIGNTDFFKIKEIDFVWGFEAWTGVFATVNNIPVNYISVKDTINLDGYTPLVITNTNMLDNHKNIVKKFMKATIKGYNYAISHPVEAANILLEEYPELNKNLILASQKYVSKKYKDKSYPWGYQSSKIWDTYVKWQYNNNVTDKVINSSSLYSNEFLN